jgi:hypothetical protein
VPLAFDDSSLRQLHCDPVFFSHATGPLGHCTFSHLTHLKLFDGLDDQMDSDPVALER